jgi:hypothetical protein
VCGDVVPMVAPSRVYKISSYRAFSEDVCVCIFVQLNLVSLFIYLKMYGAIAEIYFQRDILLSEFFNEMRSKLILKN